MRRARTWTVFFLLAIAAGAIAQDKPAFTLPGLPSPFVEKEKFDISVRLAPAEQAPGHAVVAEVTFKCPDKWYIYADKVSVELTADADGVVSAGTLRMGTPSLKKDEYVPEPFNYFDGEFKAQLPLNVKAAATAGPHQVQIRVGYQGCSTTQCFMPTKLEFPLTLTVLEAAAEPRPVQELVAPVVVAAPSVAPPSGDAGSIGERSLLVAVLIAFLAGLGLALTPCVYPMIPITVSVIGASASGSKLSGLGRSLVYVLGISMTYATLGVVSAGTGRAFGTLLQHPAVYLTLAAMFLAMAAAMLDVFSIQLPGSWAGRLQGKLRGRAGLAGIFVLGLLSGVAVTACSAPVVIAAMGYTAQRGNLLAGFLVFFAIAWGMGTPLVVLGTFSGLARSLPKSGEWMNVVKHGFALGLVAAALYFVGLSGVLPAASFRWLTGGFLLVASVFVGAFDRLEVASDWWPRIRKAAGLLLLAGAVATLIGPRASVGPQAEGMDWLTSEQAGVQAAADQGRPVMLYFWQERCRECTVLKKRTFPDPRVVAESRRFVLVRFDGTRSGDEDVKSVLDRYGVVGFPTIVFINSGGQVLTELTVVGYIKPADLATLMQSVK